MGILFLPIVCAIVYNKSGTSEYIGAESEGVSPGSSDLPGGLPEKFKQPIPVTSTKS